VQTYPAIVQDLARLLRRLPPAFWRQLGFDPVLDGPSTRLRPRRPCDIDATAARTLTWNRC
jgi:hypothetical protein